MVGKILGALIGAEVEKQRRQSGLGGPSHHSKLNHIARAVPGLS